ncbi:MAG: hypothetical protein K0R28_5017 [Paenibacillus sp.]|nr:hypothetical protein [Paenibacillus sp.]
MPYSFMEACLKARESLPRRSCLEGSFASGHVLRFFFGQLLRQVVQLIPLASFVSTDSLVASVFFCSANSVTSSRHSFARNVYLPLEYLQFSEAG